MFSVRDLKNLINERLSAAVVEIYKVFQQTIDKRADGSDRHRRLLDNSWTRRIPADNAVSPQRYLCKEEALFEQQLNDQEKNSNIKQEELGHWQVKTEQEELCTSQDAEKLAIKLEFDIRLETPAIGQSDREPSQQHVYKEEKEDVLFEPQLNTQEKNSNVNPEELAARQVKTEQEELYTTQIAEKLTIKLESDMVLETPTAGQSDEQFYYSCVKEMIREKLTSAVKEILTVFQRSVSRFEEERRLMEIFWQPRVRLCRAELSQQHVYKEEREGVFFEPQLNNQEELEPRQVKMEQEELCTTGIAEKLAVKLESDMLLETPTAGQSDELFYYGCVEELIGEGLTAAVKEISTVFEKSVQQFKEERRLMEIFWQPRVRLCKAELSQQHVCKEETEEECLSTKQERPTSMATRTCEGSDSETLFSHSSSANESQMQAGSEGMASGSRNAKMKAMATILESRCDTVTEITGFKCGICGKIFQSKVVLNRHCKTHAQKNPIKCDICSKTYSSKQTLKLHLKFHAGEMPYSCELCGKGFGHQGQLNTHNRMHTGEKPYSCEMCGKGFSQNGNLKVHIRIHTGEKPCSCDTCGKRFIYSSHLKSHMRIHNNLKPYSCGKCGESFRHKITLTRHVRRKHGGEEP